VRVCFLVGDGFGERSGVKVQDFSLLFCSIRNCLMEIFQPEKIIIFGSYATGTATSESDIDIMLVVNDKKYVTRDFILKGRLALREMLRSQNNCLAFDLVINEKDFFEQQKIINGSLQYDVSNQGIVIFEH
jgi:predicted nucleotidyltransferase